MLDTLASVLKTLRSMPRAERSLTLFVFLIIAVLQTATAYLAVSSGRQAESTKQQIIIVRTTCEVNNLIAGQNYVGSPKPPGPPSAIAAPGKQPPTRSPSTRYPRQVQDIENPGLALQYAKSAQEYTSRGEEVRAIEAYGAAAEALPKVLLAGRELLPAVDLNDREARSKLLAAFKKLFAETTLERLREMEKGN
jgi:hypothetical protein